MTMPASHVPFIGSRGPLLVSARYPATAAPHMSADSFADLLSIYMRRIRASASGVATEIGPVSYTHLTLPTNREV